VLEDDLIEGFRKTWEKFFPEAPDMRTGVIPPEYYTAEETLQAGPKVIPFVSPRRPAPVVRTGFEEGFPSERSPVPEGSEEKSTVNIESPRLPDEKQEVRLIARASKDVKRVSERMKSSNALQRALCCAALSSSLCLAQAPQELAKTGATVPR